MQHKTGRVMLFSQLIILIIFFMLTICNEVFDLPHYLLGDSPTTKTQRKGEIITEIVIFISVVTIEFLFINYLVKRIRVLEGFIPICASCKKIRHQDNWEQIEDYITKHSLAKFSHSICPDCVKKIYPEFIQNSNKVK